MVKNLNILAVDNEVSLANTLSRILTDEGYTVRTAYDGDEAIDVIKISHVDLVILDIQMPTIDGFEVLRFVKHNYPSIKVIMLTGFSDLANAMHSKKMGADDFIGKPYDLCEMLMSIQRLLPS
jgi:DNA-binding response OmpR family regulator